APSDITVLITGESGTGKELIAHSIHQLSNRSDKPFISVNCAAIPEDLFESELFGYEAGAFTGAKTSGKEGKFQLAEGGTLFLDEIGDMPLNSQVKLLRVLQENEIQTLGGTAAYQINVRIIVATNRHLEALVAENLFREDLYYRVNMINFHLPPLLKRRNDIKILANYLLSKTANKMKKRVTSFSRSEEHTSELQSRFDLVCRLLLEKKKQHTVLSAQQGGEECGESHSEVQQSGELHCHEGRY